MCIDMCKTLWLVYTKDIFILQLLNRNIYTIYTYSYLQFAIYNHQTVSQVSYKTHSHDQRNWYNAMVKLHKSKCKGESKWRRDPEKKERGYFLLSLGFNALPTYANQELRAVSASPRGRQRQRQVQTGLLAFYDNNNSSRGRNNSNIGGSNNNCNNNISTTTATTTTQLNVTP